MAGNIKVQHGAESMDKFFSEGEVTIGTVLGNSSVKAVLGYGDNVRALVDGVEQPLSAVVSEGDVVVIETKANTKAKLIEQRELVQA